MRLPWWLTIALGAVGFWATQAYYVERHAPCDEGTPECELRWLMRYLDLSEAQEEVVYALHRNQHPSLRRLFSEREQVVDRLKEFERIRRQEDRIDFLEFSDYLLTKDEIENAYSQAAIEYLARLESTMTESQRRRLHHILEHDAAPR